MTKPRKTLDSYTIKPSNKSIKPGDCVLMRPSDSSKPSYVAKIHKIESDSKQTNVKVHVQWYYRPEESIGGRRQFHGIKELFLSDHRDVQSADTIEGKCTVHTFTNYTKLDAVGNDDFFCRFDYNSVTGAFNPDKVVVYCKCEMPYNPDNLMVQCDACTDWFHPACIEMSPKEAKKIEHFFCENCSTEEQRLLQSSNAASRHMDMKTLFWVTKCSGSYTFNYQTLKLVMNPLCICMFHYILLMFIPEQNHVLVFACEMDDLQFTCRLNPYLAYTYQIWVYSQKNPWQ